MSFFSSSSKKDGKTTPTPQVATQDILIRTSPNRNPVDTFISPQLLDKISKIVKDQVINTVAVVRLEMQQQINALQKKIEEQQNQIMYLNEDLNTQKEKVLKVSASGPIIRGGLKSMDYDNGAVQIGRMPAKVVKGMMSPGRGKATVSPRPSQNGSLNNTTSSVGQTHQRNLSKYKQPISTLRSVKSPVRDPPKTFEMSVKSQSRRSPTRLFTGGSPRGGKSFKPSFEKPSAEKDVVDQIYKEKDPISVSIKQRTEEGSIMSLIKPKDKADPFFFSLKLNGPGLILQEDPEVIKKEKKRMTAIKEKIAKGSEILSHAKLPDPISESIQQRKDYGSYLSVIKNKDKVDFAGQDREVFTLDLQGKGISSKHLKMTAQEMLATGEYNFAAAPTKRTDIQFMSPDNSLQRRKLSDRKKSSAKSKSIASSVENYKPTEQDLALFEPLMYKAMEDNQNLPEEVQNNIGNHGAQAYQNPQIKEQDFQDMFQIFDQHDKNGNGLIDSTEFKGYMRSYALYREKKFGGQIPFDDTSIHSWFEAQNVLSPDVRGISKDDLRKSDKIQIACVLRMLSK